MRGSEITAAAGRRLRGSFGASVSLSFASLFFYVALLFLIGHLPLSAGAGFWLSPGAGVLYSVCGALLLLSPFRLGTKGWYLTLRGEYRSPKEAFFWFEGLRYIKALSYCAIRHLAGFLSFFLPFLPAMVLAAAVQTSLRLNSQQGILFGILLLLWAVFVLLGVFFGIYGWLGLFFADYIYLRGEAGPLQSLRLSFEVARGGRMRLLGYTVRLIPYFLLYLPGATIPVAAPKIQSGLAVYADNAIDSYTEGTICQS